MSIKDDIINDIKDGIIKDGIINDSIINDSIINDINDIINNKKCNKVKGCINRNFFSGFLFLIPAIYGFIIPYYPVMIGSVLSCISSVFTHYYKCKHKTIRIIDIICVNSIAAFFILYSFINIGFTVYSVIMYLFSIATLTTYLYLKYNNHLYEKYYFIVHLLATIGIMFFIKSYTESDNHEPYRRFKPFNIDNYIK